MLEKKVSYLSLSHSVIQTADIINNLVERWQIYFTCQDTLEGDLVETLQSVRTTSFFAIQRVFEKWKKRREKSDLKFHHCCKIYLFG